VKVIPKQRTLISGGKNNPPLYMSVFKMFKMSEQEHQQAFNTSDNAHDTPSTYVAQNGSNRI
jgi:hypothetical protein